MNAKGGVNALSKPPPRQRPLGKRQSCVMQRPGKVRFAVLVKGQQSHLCIHDFAATG